MIRRRQWFAWVTVAYALIIAVVWFGLIHLYQASRDRLDQALGQRLLAVATTLAPQIDGRLLVGAVAGPGKSSAELQLLESDFQNLRQDQILAEISLTSADGIVLVASSPSLQVGFPNDFLGLDSQEVAAALAGQSTVSPLYDKGGTLQKSAYVPVYDFDSEFDINDVVAVICVSGNADFFESLEQLKQGALATGGVVLLVLCLVGVFLHRINLNFAQYQESIRRQENLAAMGRMTAGIAHEIRNPLGIIRGAGEHLQRVLEKAGIADPVADFIPEEVDRLDHILSGYLAFGSNRQTALESLDLEKCLQRSVQLVQDELDKSGASVHLKPSDEKLFILGDRLRLQQVLLNLLLNARDAMPGGGDIEVVMAPSNNQVLVSVIDGGCGLSQVDSDRLFEPFWTTKEKGSGLGLAMSRLIIEDMNGQLHLRDRTDQTGAVAEISFPLLREGS